jgi:hypothetical protein
VGKWMNNIYDPRFDPNSSKNQDNGKLEEEDYG